MATIPLADSTVSPPIRLRRSANASVPARPEGVAYPSGSSASERAASELVPRIPPTPTVKLAPRRIAGNFLALSVAEIACRTTTLGVTLFLMHQLGTRGFGRIELPFLIVFCLVLLVRDGFEVIAAREVARHSRLVRPLVDQILALKLLTAGGLFLCLMAIGGLSFSDPTDRTLLLLYGLLLGTTALGLDFVYRGRERMGLVALSLVIRTATYATGVVWSVTDPSRLVWIPAWLVVGEALGISLVWAFYVRQYGWPRPSLSARFVQVIWSRGRSIYLIQGAQMALMSIDLLVVGLLSHWSDIGLYSAQHRMVTAVLMFGLIFQQVVFPSLARSWRSDPSEGRAALNTMVRILVAGLLPIAVGASLLAESITALLPGDFASAHTLLRVGIWRIPLLTLAFLYQTTLIALSREALGVRYLLGGALAAGPSVALGYAALGMPGACAAIVLVGLILCGAGYRLLRCLDRQPDWHHHLLKPILALLVMTPVCLILVRWHVVLAILGGGLVYVATLAAIGGIKRREIQALLDRRETSQGDCPPSAPRGAS